MEKFSDRYSTSFNKGTTDPTGHIRKTTGPLDVSFADCEGDWSECTYDPTNNNCKKTYTISNPDYGGDSCSNESGTTKECIYDHCIEIDTYTHSDSSNPGSGSDSTEYHIMRGKTLIHYKRFDKGDPKQRQDNIEYDTGELWNSDKNGYDTNIQLLKLQQIMNEYNDDENYIGLIKHDVAGEEPKFYPIILDKDSEIEIVDEASHVLYMKKNINCRGRWESCKFDSDTQQSTREYVVKYAGSGSTTISCPSSDGDIQICGEWGQCTIEDIGENKSQNRKKWEYRLPNNECDDIGKNCNHGENSVVTTEGCVQNNDCGVSWINTCDRSYDSNGNPQAIAEITSAATGNGKCPYIHGSSYSIKKVFNQSTNTYEDKDEKNDDDTINYNNYICDEDYFPIGCKKKYDVYWGNGPWAGVQRNVKDGNIEKKNGKPIPVNKVASNQPGDCWLHVYDYEEANNRFKLSNPSNKAVCPMDDYEFNGFSNIDVGQRLDTKVSDIGKGPDRISLNRKDYGYKFKYNTITNDCGSNSSDLIAVPTSSNINDPLFLDSLGSHADDLISKLGSGTIGSTKNKCNYQSLKNQYDWMVDNLLDKIDQQSESYKIELNRQLKIMNDTFDLYRGTNENINENGWGEICKQKGIYPQNCQHEELERNCTDLNQGFAGGKYKVINITSPAKYNGTCAYQQGQIMDTNNCIRIQLNNAPNIFDAAGNLIDAGKGLVNRATRWMSDIRLKKDINKIGISPMGIPIFTFRFKDDKQNTLYQGTIAQEIINIKPEAITIHNNGFYMVDYSKIDVEYKKLNQNLKITYKLLSSL